MGGRHRHADCGLFNVKRPNTVYRSDPENRPPTESFVDDLPHLSNRHLTVCLILEPGNAVATRRVVPDDAREHDDAPCGGIRNERRELSRVDRVGCHRDKNRFAASYRFILHTITIMQDDSPAPTSGPTPGESDLPSVFNRNEHDAPSVAVGMEPTENPELDGIERTGLDLEPPPISDQWGVRPVPVSEQIVDPPQGRGPNPALFFLGVLVAGILGAVLTVAILAATGTFDDPTPIATPTTTPPAAPIVQTIEVVPPQIINNLGAAVNPTAVAAKALDSIVTVIVSDTPADGESPPVGVGSGSGVVISADGFIVTNHHVIDGGDIFEIIFEDGRVYQATLVGSDDLTDLAVLQIEASGLIPVEFGATDSLRIGDPAVAIGNPLGQEGGSSVTVGIISAFDRRVEFADDTFLHGMIQTDAAINSGSSGGALLDAEGKLIGITSAIGVSQAGPEGIGYAIPIELVNRITAEIIETGDVAHPFLGVSIATYSELSEDGAIAPAGALIDSIEGPDSAAGAAGLEPDDVITRIGGKEITSQTDLILAVRLYRVGDEVEFVAIREGETITFTVVMGQRPAEFGG